MNRSLLSAAVVASLGGLLFGFDTAVISGTTEALTKVYDLTPNSLGFTVASALIGTILGALIAGKPADRLGRRSSLEIIAVLYFVSAVGCAFAWDWYAFLFFRFIGGIGVGASSVVAPMYIAEISPAPVRGRLVALTQFNIVFGILLAYLSNYVITRMALGANEWRWMFGVAAFPSVAFLLLLFVTPRSPRWLMTQGRVDEARTVLASFGSDKGSVERELRLIQDSLSLEHHSMGEPLLQRNYSKPIKLAIAIAMFNQLSGINAVMYYAPLIFQKAGAGLESALLQAVIVGGTNLVFTMTAMTLIDRFGRRKLMIVGSVGYIVSLASVAHAFYTMDPNSGDGSRVVLISLLVFIASHAFGQGAVIWVFLTEIFPNRVRASGNALGCFVHWVMAAVISWTFPIFALISPGHIFAFYSAMMVLQLIWAWRIMPETKGIPLEEIQKKFGIE